ncbi:MAG TPA: hypothetical protein PKC99_19100, partial [Anaerolineales bacterium]|nr:hypothetical protein [Anaerolineales bacterium]
GLLRSFGKSVKSHHSGVLHVAQIGNTALALGASVYTATWRHYNKPPFSELFESHKKNVRDRRETHK